jgi:hypothetical protein
MPGQTTAYLDAVLDNFSVEYKVSFNVRIHVDTNSAELREHLLARSFPPPDVRVWTLKELGDPYNLPFMHREVMQNSRDDADFFLFTEDDIFVPLAAFQLYSARREELQVLGWSYGFIRAEKWSIDNVTAIAIDNIDPIVNAHVYETLSGAIYAEPWSPYAAFYVLDKSELTAMIDDPSDVWFGGFPPFLQRERMSVGYAYKKTGGASSPYGATGWRSRALVPLTSEGRVHPDAIVWHLPSKYAKSETLGFHDLGSVKVENVFVWEQNDEKSTVTSTTSLSLSTASTSTLTAIMIMTKTMTLLGTLPP